ncbi:MAG: D-alanyl-D-alanine carboxypeptidase [Rhodomicrobium sp.]|nr:D-alanyl-D-alanine carboxypeptidase [Rhodomicrobium sp.]
MILARQSFALLIIFIAVILASGPLHAQVETEADFAFLVDVETQTVLFEKNADELMQPASMSKLLTLAVVFDAIEQGKITLQTEFPVSEYAWRTGGAPSGTSAMFAPLNTNITVEDLLQGVIVQSGNDACIILAEGLAGSEEAFVQSMTDYARRIGLKKSTFANSSGLPHPKQLMTARELAQLAMYMIQKYPKYYPYFQQKEFRYRKHIFYNRNPLIYANVGADGLKTGYTAESGYGIVGSAVQDGRRLILVQNGVKSQSGRKEDAARLLNWGFKSFDKFTVFGADETVGEALVWGGEKRYVKLRGDGDVRVLLPKNAKQRLRGEIAYLGPVIAPVREGDRIGELRVTAENGVKASAPLFAAESIERGGIVRQGIDSALTLAFGWLIHRGAGEDE